MTFFYDYIFFIRGWWQFDPDFTYNIFLTLDFIKSGSSPAPGNAAANEKDQHHKKTNKPI